MDPNGVWTAGKLIGLAIWQTVSLQRELFMLSGNNQTSLESRRRVRPSAKAISLDDPLAPYFKPVFYLLLFGLVLLLLQTIVVGRASAHAVLVKSEPANEEMLAHPPKQVTAWFSEELDSELSSMRVFDEAGRQVDNGDGRVDLNDLEHESMTVTLPESLLEGSYTVHWSAVSAEDDDLVEGEFTFGLGVAPGRPVASPKAEAASFPWPLAGLAVVVLAAGLATALRYRRQAVQPGEQLPSQETNGRVVEA